jgi:hypothetical protein
MATEKPNVVSVIKAIFAGEDFSIFNNTVLALLESVAEDPVKHDLPGSRVSASADSANCLA